MVTMVTPVKVTIVVVIMVTILGLNMVEIMKSLKKFSFFLIFRIGAILLLVFGAILL